MDLAMQLNAFAGFGTGAIIAHFAGGGPLVMFGAGTVVGALLTAALWHRVLAWVPIVCGAALAIGLGAFIGWAVGTPAGKAMGIAGGFALAALTYGRLAFRKLRPRAK